ncbi:MAG: ferredoxin family protein [Corynebacterium provencense]|jgi:NAD-dependent dihydropyrimidine dehydrogenase PreA subunit|uniref:4Fe-4S dicluster domain-containing protein n=1 Tax=Corynebacterium provencense TaxID=1737425 RepID=UPI002989DA7D|nr:ferredoxin family protein [Corynebacterium provencense]
MIEVIDPDRCTSCGLCAQICPMNVFTLRPDGFPVIADKDQCQTCFQCEAYCPADAMFVDPSRTADRLVPGDGGEDDLEHLRSEGFLGLHRRAVGWSRASGGPPRQGRGTGTTSRSASRSTSQATARSTAGPSTHTTAL